MPVVVGTLELQDLGPDVDSEYMGSYMWTVPNYSSYSSKRLIHSPIFEKGGETWRMWLFPNGSTHATPGDMSLFLHYIKEQDVFAASPVQHPHAKFSLKVIDQLQGDGIQHQINDFHNFGESNGEWGWKDFAQISRLSEEDAGLLVEDIIKVELNLFVKPKREEEVESATHSGACKPVSIRVLTDKNLKQAVESTSTSSGLSSFENCKSYCFCYKMQIGVFKDILSKDLNLSKESMRLWLCEQQPSNHIRIVKNLANKNLKLQTITDLVRTADDCLARVGTSTSFHSIDLFVESPYPEKEELPTLSNEDDWIAFLKYYNPWEMEIEYKGTIPLRKKCTPVEIMVDARMQAGMKAGADVSVYIERPVSSALVHQIRTDDILDTVGLRPGSTLIVQPKVDPAYAKGKEMIHPTALSFLEDAMLHEIQDMTANCMSEKKKTDPHDDTCVVCFARPRTVGFLHGKSLHRCVCQECAAHVMKEGCGICPLCRQKVDLVVENIF